MITIDDREYTIMHYDVTMDWDCAFDIVLQLKPMEAQRYYDKYLYRTEDGKCRACYANDTNNNWSI